MKVKEIIATNRDASLDIQLQDFFDKNPNIEIHQIKYAAAATAEGQFRFYTTSALILYNEKLIVSTPTHFKSQYEAGLRCRGICSLCSKKDNCYQYYIEGSMDK